MIAAPIQAFVNTGLPSADKVKRAQRSNKKVVSCPHETASLEEKSSLLFKKYQDDLSQ